ncbi:F-BAR domain only protein 2-like [Brachionichthys hirsutus]|uniref:F-BAR domain only protein 2-like n=1 Tax=Brachionichthys hirsutus TaxID=412623 RepID=UPI003604E433
MITPYFLESFWGEKNNGFDVLYHNMKHGQISSKELTDFIRERSTIEESYARSMTKLAKTAGNFSQLGTFAPVWDVFKSSTEKLAMCHMELVKKLQDLIKEVQKYVEEQAKAHKKTKEEVASTLEAVQNIQTTSQALQKSKESYNTKTVEQERLRKEGATQRDVDKAGVKAKKATETYKSYVEKYAAAKSEFELKMAETTQKFQDIEENHIFHMKEIIQSYSRSVDETHVQIGEEVKFRPGEERVLSTGSTAPPPWGALGGSAGTSLMLSGGFLTLVGAVYTAAGCKYYLANDAFEWTGLLGAVLLSVGVVFMLVGIFKLGVFSCSPGRPGDEESAGRWFTLSAVMQPGVPRFPPAYGVVNQEVSRPGRPANAAVPPIGATMAAAGEGRSCFSQETRRAEKMEDQRGRDEDSSSTCSGPPAYEDIYPSFSRKHNPT